MKPPTIQVIITIEPEPGKTAVAPEAREALRKAVEAFRPDLLRMAASELGPDLRPKGDASDIVQQTYLEAHRDLGTFSGRTEAEMRAWLRQILRNNVKHFARRYRDSEKRRIDRERPLEPPPASPERAADLSADTPSPSGRAIARERSLAVQAALAQLSDRSQKSVLWRARDERTFQEIGRNLGCSAVAARKLWLRSVARLRRELRTLASDSTSQFPVDSTDP
jgi:RNA polymerase sigma-70 factor (ECF subfamily)